MTQDFLCFHLLGDFNNIVMYIKAVNRHFVNEKHD